MNHLHISQDVQGTTHEGNPTLMIWSLRSALQLLQGEEASSTPIDQRQDHIWNPVSVQFRQYLHGLRLALWSL